VSLLLWGLCGYLAMTGNAIAFLRPAEPTCPLGPMWVPQACQANCLLNYIGYAHDWCIDAIEDIGYCCSGVCWHYECVNSLIPCDPMEGIVFISQVGPYRGNCPLEIENCTEPLYQPCPVPPDQSNRRGVE
jgi:hypothetical protein